MLRLRTLSSFCKIPAVNLYFSTVIARIRQLTETKQSLRDCFAPILSGLAMTLNGLHPNFENLNNFLTLLSLGGQGVPKQNINGDNKKIEQADQIMTDRIFCGHVFPSVPRLSIKMYNTDG